MDKRKKPRDTQHINNRERIRKFIEEHYEITETAVLCSVLVHQFYLTQTKYRNTSYREFIQHLTTNPEIKKSRRGWAKLQYINVTPTSIASQEYHNHPKTAYENPEKWRSIHFQEEYPTKMVTGREGGEDDKDYNIGQFIASHYMDDNQGKEKLDLREVFQMYQRSKLYKGETIEIFQEEISHSHNLTTTVTNKTNVTHTVTLTPTSTQSKEHHKQCQPAAKEISEGISIAMANIQGLITRRKNKCKFLRDVTRDSGCKHQIIMLKET